MDKYRVITKNPLYNNFVIGWANLEKCKEQNNILKFVYEEDGETVVKYVDMEKVGCKLKYLPQKQHVDEETGELKSGGLTFYLPEDVIYNYNDSAFRKKMQHEMVKSDWDALASMGIIINKK